MDNVNHPSHYEKSCSIECIEAMELVYGKKALLNFCKLNAFKYIWRYKNKNGKEDLNKANWYCNKALNILAEMNGHSLKQVVETDYFNEQRQIQDMLEFVNNKIEKETTKEK